MANMTGNDLLEALLLLKETDPDALNLPVVTSDDPEDGFNFQAREVRKMVLVADAGTMLTPEDFAAAREDPEALELDAEDLEDPEEVLAVLM